MRRFFKWMIGGISGLVLLALLGGLLVYLVLVSLVSMEDKTLQLAGLSAPVTVVFDREAVPHISAENHRDAAHALGYVHARDRLWQMEVLRMAGQGRLSEMFGEATLETDTFLRTIDMARAARSSFEELMPETQRVVKAYVSGINAYMGRRRGMLEPAFGPEFMILGHTPEDWEAWQSVLVIKVMGLTLGHNMRQELTRFELARNGFSSDEIDELIPYGPRDNPPRLPDLLNVYGLDPIEKNLNALKLNSSKAEALAGLQYSLKTGQSASNNWVISGSRTDTGKPILANDPHLGLTAPSTFHLAHLSWQEDGKQRDVIGGIVPGTPFVVVGRTNDVAWGLTTTNLDSQDLFLEQLDMENGTYRTEEGWLPLSEKTVVIKADEGKEKEITVYETRHGPLLPRTYQGIDAALPEGYGLALNWPGLAADDTTLDAMYLNNLAESLNGFMLAGKHTVSPMQSIVIADVKGNIGVTAVARSPKRKPANKIHGRAPVPGWLPLYHWDGFVDFNDQLQVRNPSTGALTTANANFLPEDFGTHISYDWAEHFRQARAEELVLGRTEPHTIDVSKDIIGDSYSPAMVRFREIAEKIMRDGAGPHTDIRNAISSWDGMMNAERPEPLIMLAWFRHLNIGMLEDDLGPLFARFERGRITPLLGMLERTGSRNWCDNRSTGAVEECADLLASSLNAAIKELGVELGPDWQQWKYGDLHVAYNEHRPFGQVDALASFFNLEAPMSGGPYTLLRAQTSFQLEKPYRSTHGAAYRAIYDLSDLNQSMFIQSTGQSGHFLSPHYDDFVKRWTQVRFLPMTTDADVYRDKALGIWRLNPT